LFRPLPRRRSLLHVEDGVAAGEVLSCAGEDRAEGLEDALPPHRNRRNDLRLPRVERAVERLDLERLREVPLVVLEDERHGGGVEVMGEEVLCHLPEALDVLLPAVEGGVGDENERVGSLQAEAARGRVHRLAGDGEDLEAQVEAAEAGGPERQQVEEDRPVLRGVDRDQLPPALGAGAAVQDLQVGGLSPDGRPVIDELDLDRALAVVQLDHGGIRGWRMVPVPGGRCHPGA
jgi:hypothetical protein